MFEKIKSHILLLVILAISIGLFFIYLNIQPALTYSFSDLFDGNEYLKIFQYYRGEAGKFLVPYPYNLRIMVPFMAALLPYQDPIVCFNAINLFFLLLFIIVIYQVWKSLNISQEYILVGYFWLLIHWTGIIRLNIFDPVTVDVPIYFFQAMLLWIIFKQKYNWLFVLTPFAVLQKESFLAVLVILLVYYIYLYRNKKTSKEILVKISLATILALGIIGAVNYYYPPSNPDRNAFITILILIRQTVLNPFRIIRWLVAIFTAFGPLLILTFFYGFKKKVILNENQWLLLLSFTYFFFGLLAGGDMTRIVFLGFPFIMTWMLVTLKDVKGFLFKAAFITGLPLLKILGTLADPSIFGWNSFYKWYPEYTNPIIVLLWAGYAVMCLVIFRVIEKKLSVLP